MVFYQVFLLSHLQVDYRIFKRLREFEEIEIARQSCTEVTVNSKGENS